MLKNLIQATLLMVLDYISDFTNFRSCCRMRIFGHFCFSVQFKLCSDSKYTTFDFFLSHSLFFYHYSLCLYLIKGELQPTMNLWSNKTSVPSQSFSEICFHDD